MTPWERIWGGLWLLAVADAGSMTQPGIERTVAKGDTCLSLSHDCGITVQELVSLNGGESSWCWSLRPGQKVSCPSPKVSGATADKPLVTVHTSKAYQNITSKALLAAETMQAEKSSHIGLSSGDHTRRHANEDAAPHMPSVTTVFFTTTAGYAKTTTKYSDGLQSPPIMKSPTLLSGEDLPLPGGPPVSEPHVSADGSKRPLTTFSIETVRETTANEREADRPSILERLSAERNIATVVVTILSTVITCPSDMPTHHTEDKTTGRPSETNRIDISFGTSLVEASSQPPESQPLKQPTLVTEIGRTSPEFSVTLTTFHSSRFWNSSTPAASDRSTELSDIESSAVMSPTDTRIPCETKTPISSTIQSSIGSYFVPSEDERTVSTALGSIIRSETSTSTHSKSNSGTGHPSTSERWLPPGRPELSSALTPPSATNELTTTIDLVSKTGDSTIGHSSGAPDLTASISHATTRTENSDLTASPDASTSTGNQQETEANPEEEGTVSVTQSASSGLTLSNGQSTFTSSPGTTFTTGQSASSTSDRLQESARTSQENTETNPFATRTGAVTTEPGTISSDQSTAESTLATPETDIQPTGEETHAPNGSSLSITGTEVAAEPITHSGGQTTADSGFSTAETETKEATESTIMETAQSSITTYQTSTRAGSAATETEPSSTRSDLGSTESGLPSTESGPATHTETGHPSTESFPASSKTNLVSSETEIPTTESGASATQSQPGVTTASDKSKTDAWTTTAKSEAASIVTRNTPVSSSTEGPTTNAEVPAGSGSSINTEVSSGAEELSDVPSPTGSEGGEASTDTGIDFTLPPLPSIDFTSAFGTLLPIITGGSTTTGPITKGPSSKSSTTKGGFDDIPLPTFSDDPPAETGAPPDCKGRDCEVGEDCDGPECTRGGDCFGPGCIKGGACIGPKCTRGGQCRGDKCEHGGGCEGIGCVVGGGCFGIGCVAGGVCVGPSCHQGGPCSQKILGDCPPGKCTGKQCDEEGGEDCTSKTTAEVCTETISSTAVKTSPTTSWSTTTKTSCRTVTECDVRDSTATTTITGTEEPEPEATPSGFYNFDDEDSTDQSVWDELQNDYDEWLSEADNIATTTTTQPKTTLVTSTKPRSTVTVTAKPKPTPKAECDFADGTVYWEFHISGIFDWADDGGKKLKEEESGCGALTNWKWLDGSNHNQGHQASFRLPFFMKSGCVERAIVSAGGPKIQCEALHDFHFQQITSAVDNNEGPSSLPPLNPRPSKVNKDDRDTVTGSAPTYTPMDWGNED